jgi:uncharacterized protein (TIGR00255 family)
MIKSMTGFGSAKAEQPFGSVTIELKTVNSRYLDVQFRMPDELRLAEHPIRERIASGLTRGKIEVRISFARAAGVQETSFAPALLHRVAEQLGQARQFLPETPTPTLSELLSWSGAAQQHIEPESWAKLCLDALEPALAQLVEGRQREGHRLAQAMLATAVQVRAVIEVVQAHMPALVVAHRDRLANKLRETLQVAFPAGFSHITGAELSERIASESSLFAIRIDVAEELARLTSHLTELEFLLNPGKTPSSKKTHSAGSAGKRLDFLFQEMNREANTLGSKAGSLEMTQAAIDLKLLIEQMREQAMNIE